MARNKYPEETVRLILDVAQQLFLTKGYDSTSIQDIINGLGGLSKGAVYHHFKSKEDIFDSVCNRYNEQLLHEHNQILKDNNLTGYEKLKKMFQLSLASTDGDIAFTVAPDLLDNPKLLAMQFRQIFNDVSPNFLQPVVEEGISDGSICTEYPQELSEVILLLANIWLNPLVIKADIVTMERRVLFFNSLLKSFGIELLDDEMLEGYKRYCILANKNKER